MEAEQSSYYREYPEIVGVGQSDTANNTLCRYCFQGTSVFGQKAPGAPVFGHCPFLYKEDTGNGLAGANPAVNTPRPSRGTRIESGDFIVLIGDP